LVSIKKRSITQAHVSLSAEPPPQRAPGTTNFFNTTRVTKRNLLAEFLAQQRPPGASISLQQKTIFSLLANTKTFLTHYNEKAAQSRTAQSLEFAASFLTHI
jgi:hypothetical protein